MAMASSSEGHYLLWGWERFFMELSSFLCEAERQRGNANQCYSEYVLEHLQTSLLSLSALMNHLRTAVTSNNQQAAVSARYYSEIADLVVCVHQIASQWEHYIDEQMMRDAATSYVAPQESAGDVGRPRVFIPREQYLVLLGLR